MTSRNNAGRTGPAAGAGPRRRFCKATARRQGRERSEPAQRERERERESAHDLRDPAGCQSAQAMVSTWGPAHRASVRVRNASA
eukprot:13041561-Heterocapsa_arctica.AAC.1